MSTVLTGTKPNAETSIEGNLLVIREGLFGKFCILFENNFIKNNQIKFPKSIEDVISSFIIANEEFVFNVIETTQNGQVLIFFELYRGVLEKTPGVVFTEKIKETISDKGGSVLGPIVPALMVGGRIKTNIRRTRNVRNEKKRRRLNVTSNRKSKGGEEPSYLTLDSENFRLACLVACALSCWVYMLEAKAPPAAIIMAFIGAYGNWRAKLKPQCEVQY